MPDSPSPAFQIGPVPIYGRLILSPMEGYSDMPFRSLCRKLGSAMSYSEFVNALDVLQGNKRIRTKLVYSPDERPVVFQIFDSDPQRLLEAALRLQELEPDIIDVNMGCSVRRVSGRGAGAGLLRTPKKVAQIFRLLSSELDVPVTGKIRLGWDANTRNHLMIARIVEENGGALVAVHGRTKQQGLSGKADWDAIAEVKAALSIPVIANGDVASVADIEHIREHTRCDGVMIGRAAIGNPWIFAGLDRQDVPPEIVHQTMIDHLRNMLDFYGQYGLYGGDYGLVLFRKHAKRYLRPYHLSGQLRQRLLTIERPEEFFELLEAALT